MARDTLLRTLLVGLALGALACGGKEEEAAPAVDMAAMRARRDSIRQAAVQDSTMRARYTVCSDSVTKVLGRSAAGRAALQKLAAGTVPPEVTQACGTAPAPKPAPAATAAKPDTTKPAAATAAKPAPGAPATAAKPDTTRPATSTAAKPAPGTPVEAAKPAPATPAPATAAKPAPAAPATAAKPDTTKKVAAAPAPAPATPAKPTLTPQQLQVMRADSIRQVRERARQDSLRQLAERRTRDSLARVRSDSIRADSIRLAKETEVVRESFTYAGGARDPFVSLITQDKVGPEFNDLLLVGVYLDARRAANSIAVLRDKSNQKRYTLRVGERLGRLKVAQIRQTDVVFTVEDIGFERQETLSLRKREDQTP